MTQSIGICKCVLGFYGSKCQYKINCEHCMNYICYLNGVCSKCPIGFDGDFCNIKTCTNMQNMCGEHGKNIFNLGKCLIKGSERICKCDLGWGGNFCRVKSCDKYNSFCNDNGIIYKKIGACVIKDGDYACVCNKGWSGNRCNEVSCNNITKCGNNGIQ